MANRTIQSEEAARSSPAIRDYVRLTLALAALVLVLIVGGYWILDHTPIWVYWEIGLIFLLGLDLAYALAIGSVIVLIPLLAFLRSRGRGDSRRRAATARGFLLCFSIAFAAIMAESVSAFRLAGEDRVAVLPAGGGYESRDWTESRLPGAFEGGELPTEFPLDPNDGTIVVTIVGESSAAGIPFDRWLSVASIVAWRLEREIPGKKFIHQIVAKSGATLELQFKELKNMKRRPDVLIVYCGHNEFSARIERRSRPELLRRLAGPEPLGGRRRTGDGLVVLPCAGAAERRQVPDRHPAAGERLPRGGRHAGVHRGRVHAPPERFPTPARRARVVRRASGAILVLLAPPANDSGFDPNRSFLPATTTKAERRAFAYEVEAASRLEATDPDAAIERYRALVARQPGFSATHYRLARLLEAKGEWTEVYEHDLKARDADGYPMRCLTAFQQAYRETAARHDCIYIDGQKYFHAVSVHGLLDDSLFQDAMHPSFRAQLALAQAVLRGLHARRAFGWPAEVPTPTIDPLECIRHFGIVPGVWRYVCLWGIMFYDRTSWATYDRSRRSVKRQAYVNAASKIEAGASPESVGLPNIGTPDPIPLVPYGSPYSMKPLDSPERRRPPGRRSDRHDDDSAEAVVGAAARQPEGERDVADEQQNAGDPRRPCQHHRVGRSMLQMVRAGEQHEGRPPDETGA